MFKSKLFWGGVLLCGVAILLGILIHKANQPQETIKIYKTVTPERSVKSQPSAKLKVQAAEDANEPEIVSDSADSDTPTDFGNFTPVDTQFSEVEVQTEESTLSADVETETGAVSEEERFFGLTLAEIKEKIPVLEEAIHTNLTKAVELYTDLTSTDGIEKKSPELAAWRDETWAEIKRLFHEASRQKIPRYVSYLKVTGGDNPLLPGGWISELTEPLPMQVTYNGTFQ
ncbi:MAG: hypothetical protein OXH00_23155 [Candidatus Poribacteria bacterium]|nr:hypothetical protein [Candidatus Poribacteria bacterium]